MWFLAGGGVYPVSQQREQAVTTQLQDIDAGYRVGAAGQTAERVRQDAQELSRLWSAPTLAWSLFSKRCTLIATMRYSLLISGSMSTMLFICDVATVPALAVLFFQTSGGALAEDADDECEPANLSENLGQILAVGTITIIVGILPSMILSKLHQRDFITHATDSECQRQLRHWQLQDRIIFFGTSVIITFCLIFDLLFVANVTHDDGKQWCAACLTSMAQTLFLVPLVMTLAKLSTLLAFKTSTKVHKEVHLLCCVDTFSTEQSSFHRQPRSPWTSAFHRRKARLEANRKADSDAEWEAKTQADLTTDGPCWNSAFLEKEERSGDGFDCGAISCCTTAGFTCSAEAGELQSQEHTRKVYI